MNRDDKERILRALMGNARTIPQNHPARKSLERACASDIEALELIVDDIVRREVELAVAWQHER